jgi:hypothetical protein
MIDVKEAAKRAAEYFGNLYSEQRYSDILLEEVEMTDDEENWLITLSYAYEPLASILDPLTTVDRAFTPPKPKPRKYKLFKIDGATGNVKAMKIRSLN